MPRRSVTGLFVFYTFTPPPLSWLHTDRRNRLISSRKTTTATQPKAERFSLLSDNQTAWAMSMPEPISVNKCSRYSAAFNIIVKMLLFFILIHWYGKTFGNVFLCLLFSHSMHFTGKDCPARWFGFVKHLNRSILVLS